MKYAAYWLGVSQSKDRCKQAACIISGLIIIVPLALVLTRLGLVSLLLSAILRIAVPSTSITVLIAVAASIPHNFESKAQSG